VTAVSRLVAASSREDAFTAAKSVDSSGEPSAAAARVAGPSGVVSAALVAGAGAGVGASVLAAAALGPATE
jgi:hypothetical protein